MEPEVKAEAEQREKAGVKQPSGNFPQGKTRDVVGSFVRVSGKTLEKAEALKNLIHLSWLVTIEPIQGSSLWHAQDPELISSLGMPSLIKKVVMVHPLSKKF